MTKGDYLAQLAHKLRVLPENERQDALEYYDGYLSDAENERTAIAQLGSPGEVSANILANYVAKSSGAYEADQASGQNGTRGAAPIKAAGRGESDVRGARGIKTAWMIILALFALPIGLPLVISLAAVANEGETTWA